MLPFRHPDKPVETTPEVVVRLSTSDWVGQAKYDGWRLNIYFDGDKVRCLSRRANEMQKIVEFSSKFIEDLGNLPIPADSVLDAEFVGPRGNQEPTIYIFDCLAYNGEWLTDQPFEKRWRICQNLTQLPDDVKLAATVYNDFLRYFEALKADWQQHGNLSLTEGIVLKHRQGKLDLSLRESTKNNRLLKCKFRDIRGKRW